MANIEKRQLMPEEMLPVGMLVDVHDHSAGIRYVATIVGYDAFHTKYELSRRFLGWGEYIWSDGGWWAFRHEVVPHRNEVA